MKNRIDGLKSVTRAVARRCSFAFKARKPPVSLYSLCHAGAGSVSWACAVASVGHAWVA